MSMNLGDIVHLIGKKVRINRGGPDSIEGILTAIHNDYLTIKVKVRIPAKLVSQSEKDWSVIPKKNGH